MKKIFRKKILAFFLSALLVLALSLPVFADMGPKPSVTLQALLHPGPAAMRSPCWAIRPSTAPGPPRQTTGSGMGSREAWEAFRNYPAPEGYYFLGYFQEYPGTARRGVRLGLLPAQ